MLKKLRKRTLHICILLFFLVFLYFKTYERMAVAVSFQEISQLAFYLNGSSFVPWRNDTSLQKTQLKHFHLFNCIPENYFHSDDYTWIDSWSKISPFMYVYSAYWDTREADGFLKLIGILDPTKSKSMPLYCYLRYKSSDKIQKVRAAYSILPEGHRKPYVAVFFTCLINSTSSIPSMVKMTASSIYSSSWLHVHHTDKKKITSNGSSVAVCIRPLFNNYSALLELAQFLSYYTMHGFDHFTFYGQCISASILKFLQELPQVSKFSVDFLPWYMPLLENTWSYGQLPFTQDCIYRHMHKFRYVIVVDLDEYIVPLKTRYLADLFRSFSRTYDTFFFKNVFLRRNESLSDTQEGLFTMAITQRDTKVWQVALRSKYAVRPQSVIVAGIHNIWKSVPGSRKKIVNNALMFHYRKGNISEKYKTGITTDDTMVKYKEEIMLTDVMKLCKKLSDVT